MYLRCGGVFDDYFITRLLPSPTVKEYWNQSTFGDVMGKSGVSCFFDSRGSSSSYMQKSNLLLELPFTVVKRADLSSLQPTRDAVEVKGMLHIQCR